MATKIIDTDSGSTRDYASLFDWEAARNGSLSEPEIAKCRASTGAADTTAVTLAGWTTSAANYIKIWTDPTDTGTGGDGAGGTHRHDGKWNTSAFRLETENTVITIASEALNVYIIGIQIKLGTSNDYRYAIRTVCTGDVHVEQCLIRAAFTGTATANHGIYWSCSSSTATLTVINTIFYGWVNGTNDSRAIYIDPAWDSVASFYNCTFVDCRYGIVIAQGHPTAKNCLTQSCYDGFNGTFTSLVTCLSDTAQAGGTDEHSGVTDGAVTFAGTGDYHLASGDSAAIDQGTDLSTTFTVDIDNVTRPTGAGTWDIGADEYVAPATTRRRAHVQTVG